jgi:hypothetical protein
MGDIPLEFIEEDEVLPDLEIRAYVTLEEMLDFDPKFLAFTEDNLVVLFNQLLGNNNSRAIGFHKLHTAILNPVKHSTFANILPLLDAVRSDTEDIADYIELRDRAYRGANYALQQFQLEGIATPFDVSATSNRNPKYNLPITFTLNTSKYDLSKLLSHDHDTQIPLLGARWKTLDYSDDSYVVEDAKINNLKTKRLISWSATHLHNNNLEKWAQTYILPKLSSVLKHTVKQLTTLHEINRKLTKNGYSLDSLDDSQFAILVNHLESLVDVKVDDANVKGDTLTNSNIKTYSLNFWDILKDQYDHNISLTNSDTKKQLEDKITYYINALPQFAPIDASDSINPSQLAHDISHKIKTIDEVLDILKRYNSQVILNRATKLFKNINAFSIPSDDSLDKEKNLSKLPEQSIKNEEGFIFLSKWDEMAEVEIGNDTSTYDGSPFTMLDNVFEETRNNIELIYNEADDREMYDDDNDNPITVDLPILEGFDMNDGGREIFTSIVPDIMRLKETCGLPFDIENWILHHIPYISRRSRIEELCALVPDIPIILAKRVCSSNLEAAIAYTHDFINESLAEKIRTIYPAIYNAWLKECQYHLKLAITIYFLSVLDTSLNNQLNFSILRGMLSYAHLWSPFGIPLKSSTEDKGVLLYLSAVAGDLFKLKVTDLREEILEIAKKEFRDKLDDMKTRWKAVKDKSFTKDKAHSIKDSLLKTIQAITDADPSKRKGLNYALTSYIQSYLYLPTLLPKSFIKKQGTWANGCCLIAINDKYQPDKDWKTDLVPLWRLKEAFIKDRWLITKRTQHKMLTPAATPMAAAAAASVSKKVATKMFIDLTQRDHTADTEEDNTIVANDLWLPQPILDILNKGYDGFTFASEYLQQTISKLYITKAKDITDAIKSLKDIDSIKRILSIIATNIFQVSPLLTDSLAIIKSMKQTLALCKEASIPIAIYALAKAIALPCDIQKNGANWRLIRPDDVTDEIYKEIIITRNQAAIIQSTKTHTMMTVAEINEYIAKMREEQKNTKIDYQNALTNEDRKLLGDLKRFGFKDVLLATSAETDEQVEEDGEEVIEDATAADAEIAEDGEIDFYQRSADADNNNIDDFNDY